MDAVESLTLSLSSLSYTFAFSAFLYILHFIKYVVCRLSVLLCCLLFCSPTHLLLGWSLDFSPTLLFRDISYGREANPVPVVNECDDENYPHDFLYVNENVETIPLNINRTITSLRVSITDLSVNSLQMFMYWMFNVCPLCVQSCTCQGDCSSMHCVCGHSSIRCWYTKVCAYWSVRSLLLWICLNICSSSCRRVSWKRISITPIHLYCLNAIKPVTVGPPVKIELFNWALSELNEWIYEFSALI